MPEVHSNYRRVSLRRFMEACVIVSRLISFHLSVGYRLSTVVYPATPNFRKLALSTSIGALLILLSASHILHADDFVIPEGLSTREAKQSALREIPLQALTEDAVKKLKPVLDAPTIFRRMPSQTIVCDEEMFQFLVRYPEVLVEIWDLMGMTKVTINRLGPYVFKGNDAAGTDCKAELVYGSDALHIYYGTGFYEGTLTGRKLDGRSVIVIHSKPSKGQNGQSLVTAQMDVFLKLDNIGADLIAKTISPLVVRSADYNYIETLRFISQLSIAAERNPQGIDQLTRRMTNVSPEIKQKFVNVSIEAALRRSRNTPEPMVPQEPRVIIGKTDQPTSR